MQLRFDFRFVIYAPKLVELDSFKHDLFIFEPYLLLAKISLKFCKYVRLTVCLSVCLFVCNIHDTGRTVQAINTKLGTYMYLGSGYRCILFGVDDIIDDVIKFKNRPNFEIAITPSIFKIERRSKAQHVALGIVHLSTTRHNLISF